MRPIYQYILLLTLLTSCNFNNQKTYEKHVNFKHGTKIEEKLELASFVVPTAKQLDRQKIEFAALLPFGINTFTGKEWGTGQDDLNLFNPTNFDADQWIKTLKDAGFDLAILTAKHHDGFCLWPTRTTNYSIASTPWQAGRGDVVKEVQKACEKYGIKFGIYISTWDRNSSSYGTPYFDSYFMDQIKELLTNYGDIYEIWIDNISNVDLHKEPHNFNWEQILATIHKLQPNALTAVVGDDIRWIGNEIGAKRSAEWSVTPLQPYSKGKASSDNELRLTFSSKDLGGRSILEKAEELHWYPAEMCVSIRPGVFYKPEQNAHIKSVADLIKIYYNSVGNNAMLLLSIPPNKEGLISKADSTRLSEFNQYISYLKTDNVVENSTVLHKVPQGESVKYNLTQKQIINTLLIQEEISHGQRIEKFSIDAHIDNEWVTIYNGNTIGYKKIIKLPKEIRADQLRINILSARNTAFISKFAAYRSTIPQQKEAVRVLNEFSTYRWKLIRPMEEGESIIDNNITTYWFGKEDIIIDLGRTQDFSGIIYTPVKNLTNSIHKYSVLISDNGVHWETVLNKEEFGNMTNNPIQQWQYFDKTVEARFIKLKVHRTADLSDYYSIAELGLLK